MAQQIKLTNLLGLLPQGNAVLRPDRIFFDIEGEINIVGDVIQFAYIRTDWDYNIKEVYSKYFLNEFPIQEGAFKVHGISEEFLYNNAENYFYEELRKLPFAKTAEEIGPVMFISYKSFDKQKLNQVSSYAYSKLLPEWETATSLNNKIDGLCYYDLYRNRERKLSSLFTDEEKAEFVEDINKIVSEHKFKSKPHDALFDSYMLYKLGVREGV